MLLIDKVGKIQAKGDKPELYIKIVDDRKETGGFYVFTSKKKDFSSDGFDNWLETLELVERTIKSRDWTIEWLDEEESRPSADAPASN